MQLFVLTRELYNRFDGAVSKTVVPRETDNKVEGSSPIKFFFIFLLSQTCRKFFVIYMFAEKACLMSYAHVKRLHSVKWRSFMLVDTATMQELLLKTCTSSAWKKRSLLLNRVWDRTAALTDVSRSSAQKSVEEKVQDEQQQPKQPPSPTSKM